MADSSDVQQPQTAGDDDVTILAASPAALVAEEFPQGLSPRELALTLKGQLLGHFHLQEFVGGGGMGAVFKALDTTLDRIVAVKVVASQSISSDDLQRRFLIEAQSTARLDHPNIARIHFVGRDRGLPYIVFEYIDGVNLRDLVVNHGRMPVGDALSFTCQIAHALAHAWQKEVVHRDIKPSNILVTREGQAKLVDMGLARFRHVGADHDLTSTGVTLGTFDYISPEQARDPREADTRSDIYSLGCTLFYMLAGRPPFAEGTAVQKLLSHQNQSPPDLSQLRPDIPESLVLLVNRMLKKSPEQRPQTPTELIGSCHQIFQELGLQPPSSPVPLPMVPQAIPSSAWRVHLPWAISLTALLAAVWWTSGGNWMANDTGAANTGKFPPLRSRIAKPAVSVIPAKVLTTVQPELLSGTEGKKFGGAIGIEEESPPLSMDIGFGAAIPSPSSTTGSSLLEFSADEPLQPEEPRSDFLEELRIDNIIIAE